MKRMLACLLLWLGTTFLSAASGLIILHEPDFWLPRPPETFPPDRIRPRPIPPPVPEPLAPVVITLDQANVRIRDQVALTSIEEEFYNPNSRPLEGTFLFPVPKGAQINKFTMEINGKPVEAELLASDKARGIYEDIVRRLKDPALLEYAGRDLFKVRIFPIEPNRKKRITLSYSQVLKSDGGLVGFVLPLQPDKTSPQPVKSLGVKVDLETTHPLKSVYSPSHSVEVKRSGPNKAVIGYEAANTKVEGDFQLFYAQEDQDVGLNLLTYKTAGEDGFFLLLASPGAAAKQGPTVPKDITFVVDTSGSMAGSKLEQAKKALLFCVENLNDTDRFEILRFATDVEPLFDKLTPVATETRERARKFIRDLRPTGGTAIDDALRKAQAARPEASARPYLIIFLTDGLPTVGQTSEDQIVGTVARSAQSSVRIFCFGIGTDVNTHLLDRITEETKAFSQYVLPEEDIEVKVSNFFMKIKEPALANLRVTFPEGIHATRLYPSPLPDLFKGEQLIAVGRYAGPGDGAVRIEGTVNGETRSFVYDAKFSAAATDHEFLPRLWATRRVGYLLDEIRLRGESKELKDEVTALARQYSIVTPYTAFLILEDETRRNVPTALRSLPSRGDASLRDELAFQYRSLAEDKSGDRAVGSARSLLSLKMAQAPSDAVQLGAPEASRLPAPTASAPINPVRVRSSAPAASRTLDAYTRPSRYVSGRTFFKNEEQWVDSEIQNQPRAKRVQVRFGSEDYFQLLRRHPEARGWLAVGPNLQVLIGETIYDIHE